MNPSENLDHEEISRSRHMQFTEWIAYCSHDRVHDSVWDQLARSFGFASIPYLGRDGLKSVEIFFKAQKIQFVYTGWEKKIASRVGVFTPIQNFRPPRNRVCYVFGADGTGEDLTTGREEETWITVPCAESGWSVTFASIILHHHYQAWNIRST